jgi:hypothetical protein
VALAGSTGGAVGTATAQPVSGALRVSHDAVLTYNWAGYSVHHDGTAFSDVQGDWVQPTASCSGNKTTLAAFFVGIDGAISSSSSVEQTGTEADCSKGSPVYFAWYEMYPAPPVTISDCNVAASDAIHAEVQHGSGKSFTVTINVNGTQCFSHAVNAPVTPDLSTAEWIAEAPATGGHFWPLTDFTQADFSNASATGNRHKGAIDDTAWDFDANTMVARGNPNQPTIKAQPGSLTDSGGTSAFTVDWVSS